MGAPETMVMPCLPSLTALKVDSQTQVAAKQARFPAILLDGRKMATAP
jgi:hypothetical protein